MALRYHVPVAAFTADHEWQPANDAKFTIPSPTGRISNFVQPVLKLVSWLIPEDYANIVLAVHWIALPIILLLTSRKLFRRVEK